jgi:hypothetical protein
MLLDFILYREKKIFQRYLMTYHRNELDSSLRVTSAKV